MRLVRSAMARRGERIRGAIAGVVLGASMALSAPAAMSQAAASLEEVEAAYIHKFVGYVEWPPKVFANPAAPIVVGVAGSDRMFELLSGVAVGRPVQGRAVQVRRLVKPEQGADVHLVFVGKEAWKDLPDWTAWSTRHPAVVTTDAPQGVDRGATLAFVQTGQRVRFEASLAAAEKSGVKLSARLLAVAERIVGAGQ